MITDGKLLEVLEACFAVHPGPFRANRSVRSRDLARACVMNLIEPVPGGRAWVLTELGQRRRNEMRGCGCSGALSEHVKKMTPLFRRELAAELEKRMRATPARPAIGRLLELLIEELRGT